MNLSETSSDLSPAALFRKSARTEKSGLMSTLLSHFVIFLRLIYQNL